MREREERVKGLGEDMEKVGRREGINEGGLTTDQ